jgi:hypothetical protein
LLWLFLASRVVRRPSELPKPAWFAAMLAGVTEADCGPCTQLVVRMAQQEGIAHDVIRAVVSGDEDAMTDDVRLVTRFTRTSLRHDIDAESFRDEILARRGRRTLVRLAYQITVSGLFPTIKYALGHGQACTRVRIGSRDVAVNRLVPAAKS